MKQEITASDMMVSADEDSQLTCDQSIDKLLKSITAFCRLRSPAIHLTDAMAKFDSIPIADLERSVPGWPC